LKTKKKKWQPRAPVSKTEKADKVRERRAFYSSEVSLSLKRSEAKQESRENVSKP